MAETVESVCNAGDQYLVPGWADLLEKGMATHHSILSWTIPWTVEPGGLQSMKSQSQTQANNLNTQQGLMWAGSKKSFPFTHAIPRIATWWCQMAYVCLFSTGKTSKNLFFFPSIFTRLPGSSLFAVYKYFQSGFNS